MSLQEFIRAMPKVELHVHLEGAIQPKTLLELAHRNQVPLPAQSVPELHTWYQFRDFDHFIQVYRAISACICSADDIEWIAREFLRGQAEQNIRYSEVIWTPYSHLAGPSAIPFEAQMAALARAAEWARVALDTRVGWVLDISRNVRPLEHSVTVADWAIQSMAAGVVGLGLGGPEIGHPPELFKAAFDRARTAGLASLPHAGETGGPESVWGAIKALGAQRIGHGVRCLEDPVLMDLLRERLIPLDVSPSSNVCLGVVTSLAEHPLPRLLEEGLCVSLNSDDPPLFNTTLTDEYLRVANAFGWGADTLEHLVYNGIQACLLPQAERETLATAFREELAQLRAAN